MNTKPPVYIVLRQSPDWAQQTYADLDKTRTFCRIIGRPETYIIDRVLLWDKTFRTSFFSARQTIKDISLENFRSVLGSKLVSLAEIQAVLDRKALYLFTDDDDWYHPLIAQCIATIDPRSCDAILWKSAAVGNGLQLQDTSISYASHGPVNIDFNTNGYAVSGEVLLQKKGNLAKVTQHFEAQATFIRKSYSSVLRHIGYASLYRRMTAMNYQSIVRLPKYLSITNKHAASTFTLTSLGDTLTPERMVDVVRTRLEANKKITLPDDLLWAKRMIDRVNDFMEDLLRSIR
jgi:hypothetical protein